MADKKKQSADEIVDSMAEEMGVKGEKPDESTDDLATDLGGIFGVSSKKKKKKPEPVVEETPDEEDEEDEVSEAEDSEAEDSEAEDSEVEEVVEVKPTPKKKSPEPVKKKAAAPAAKKEEVPASKKKHDLDGVFSTGKRGDEDVDYSASSGYLDEDDLGGAVPGGGNKALIAVIVVLVVALVGVVLVVTPVGKDLKLLLTGDLNAQRDAEVRKQEEEFNAAQKEGLAKFGNLVITGNPLYATIKLNGEMQYAQTSNGIWRELSLKPGISNFSNLPVKEKQVIEVSAPSHDAATFELTEGKWQSANGAHSFNYVATLTPKSEWDKMEADARLGSDIDNEFFGTVTLNSVPAGATIMFNNKPLLDKSGEVLKTPVTFGTVYVNDEKGKLEEVPVKVDTTLDQGHKVEIFFEGNADMPRYGTQLQRQMWTCTKKDEDAIKNLAKDHTIQHECDYSYSQTVDFTGLQAYIKRREEEKKSIEAYNAKVKDVQERMIKGETISPEDMKAIRER